ncbi:unnamed protein product [Cuscuta epithymum]|uniref:Reverse transcriptase Ty1/copia-type domain-containing protein n=1 Tax=Cuscuta epithymum TaxID=186058 RepID=A0AAV0GDZ2_9ASTE|nr:unnamed protein product [Cuscuta epithymum]
MQTRSKSGIFKPKTIFSLHTDVIGTDPSCFSEANKNLKWREAMAEEFNALITNRTWDLVPFDNSKNIVGCKWIYKTKYHSDGTVERHKARLVAQGFNQHAEATRTSTGLFISQQKYVTDLLARFHLHTVKSVRTPLASRTTLTLTDGELLTDSTEYRSMVVKRIFRYLQGTRDHGLWLQASTTPTCVRAYSDADWVGCPDSSRSTTGFAIFLGPNLVSWKSKKQPTMSKSSTEAEYRAVAYTVQDTLHIRSILFELGFPITEPVSLLCDNISASCLTANPIQHARSKHIQIDYHFVRERIAHGDLSVQYICSYSSTTGRYFY